MEVIYTGLHQTPEQIVQTAVQEDVDLVGLSILSGAHMTIFPRVHSLLLEQNAGDIILFGGGIAPDDDIKTLIREGYASAFFTPGTDTREIVRWILTALPEGN